MLKLQLRLPPFYIKIAKFENFELNLEINFKQKRDKINFFFVFFLLKNPSQQHQTINSFWKIGHADSIIYTSNLHNKNARRWFEYEAVYYIHFVQWAYTASYLDFILIQGGRWYTRVMTMVKLLLSPRRCCVCVTNICLWKWHQFAVELKLHSMECLWLGLWLCIWSSFIFHIILLYEG